MLSGNEEMVARLSAIVWLTMTEARQSEFLRAVKENYRIDTTEGAEALATLFAEWRDRTTPIGKACGVFMDHVWHYDVDAKIARRCMGYSKLDNEHFWALVHLATVTFAVRNLVIDGAAEHNTKQQFVEAVVAGQRMMYRSERLPEIAQHTEIAMRGLRRTDAPPATEDAAPANDSQGSISPDMLLLTYRNAQQLVLLLRQAEVAALHEERLRGRDKAAEVESGSTDIHRIDRLACEEAHAKGRADALHRAIETIVDTSPALLGWYDGMRNTEQLIEPHPARVRSEPLPGQRPREFAWGAPSVAGLIPSVSCDADAFEIHFAVPEAAGIHPLFRSAGEEVVDRLRSAISRLVNSAPNATIGLLRLELRDLSTANDETWRGAGRYAASWAGPAPLQSETTAARPDKIPCPWCGDAQPVPSRSDRPSLYAGDVENTQCHTCGGFYQLRFEAKHHLYARPIPK